MAEKEDEKDDYDMVELKYEDLKTPPLLTELLEQ